jgi:hypothetical protein
LPGTPSGFFKAKPILEILALSLYKTQRTLQETWMKAKVRRTNGTTLIRAWRKTDFFRPGAGSYPSSRSYFKSRDVCISLLAQRSKDRHNVRSIIGTRCVTNRVGLVSTRSCLIVIGRLEAVDVATSRHADADEPAVGGGPRCDSCFTSVLTIEKRRPIEGNGGWTGGDGTCYFPRKY